MRLLLDANAFLWWVTDSSRLTDTARTAIADDQNAVLMSIGSLWELAIKRSLGKLDFSHDFETVLRNESFELLSITYDHLHALEALPLQHRDPFDRLIIAQAIAENLTIVTSDQKFALYEASILW